MTLDILHIPFQFPHVLLGIGGQILQKVTSRAVSLLAMQ